MRILLALLLFISYTSSAQDVQQLSISVKNANAIQFSPDNQFLALAKGNKIQLYNAGNDTRIKEHSTGHTSNISDIAFSNNSLLLLAGSTDKSISMWQIPDCKIIDKFTGLNEPVIGVRFGGNDKYIVALGEKGTLSVWETETKKNLYTKNDFVKEARSLDVSKDGRYVAVAGGDKFILIYEVASGTIVKKLDGHKGWVRALAFSPDGKTLASGGDDKMIYLWHWKEGLRVKEIPQKGWIYDLEFSGDGKYLGMALEKTAIHFYNVSTGMMALELKNFKSPVLKLSIGNNGKQVASVEEYGVDVKLTGLASLNIIPIINFKDTKDVLAPQIFVSNPPNIIDNRVRVYKDLLDLRGIVTDESGVRSLRVNGIETPVHDNGNFLINIPLTFGDNYVTMEVTDVNDNIALKKFIITRKNAEGEQYNPALAKNHLLVIGINSYQYWPKLFNAVKDANDLVTVLMSKYNFEFANITVLKDEQATRANMYNALRGLIEKITAQDNLIIYFSGHGYFDEILNEGYWIPVDAHTKSSGEYISNTEVLKIVSNINSQHTFLVADACFSGALFSDSRRGYTDNVEKFRSRWGLASGRLEVVSDGSVGDTNSPFAKRFIQFLRENEKEKFAVSELVQYVKTQVAEDTNQTPIGNPLKALGDEGGEMVFYLKKN
jgi:uncharacterized protein YjiK